MSTSEQRRQHHKERVTINQVSDQRLRVCGSRAQPFMFAASAIWSETFITDRADVDHADPCVLFTEPLIFRFVGLWVAPTPIEGAIHR